MKLEEVIGTNTVNNTIELHYICLLGKYLKSRNVKLSLKGADITSFRDTIEYSMYYDFFKYAEENGYIHELGIDLPVFNEDESNLEDYFFMQSYDNVKPYFYKEDNGRFSIDMHDLGGNYTNLRLFKESIEESALLDLTAYFHVSSLFNGKTYELKPKFSETLREAPLGVASLFYIANSTISKGILKLKTYDTRDYNSLSYNTWYFLGLEQGLLREDGFSISHKEDKLKSQEFKVGNVVFLYERESTSKSRKGYKLKNSIIAVVRDVTDKEVVLEKVLANQTRLERVKKHEEFSQGVQELFKHDDFELTTFKESFRLTSLGVGYLMSDNLQEFEEYFIAPVTKVGSTEMWVEQEGFEFQTVMSIADAVFWVLKDWDVSFDEELYIDTYYGGSQIPMFYQSLVDEFTF